MDPIDLINRSFDRTPHSMAGSESFPSGSPQKVPIPIPKDSSHGVAMFAPEWNPGTYQWTATSEADLSRRGTAFVFRFPFSISCADLPPAAIELGVEGKVSIRLFPPFISSDQQGSADLLWENIPAAGKNPRRQYDVLAPIPVLPAAGGKVEADCLRVDLSVPMPSPAEGIPIEESLLGDPEPLVRHLLSLIRFRTRQWWITRDNGPRRGPLMAAFPITANLRAPDMRSHESDGGALRTRRRSVPG